MLAKHFPPPKDANQTDISPETADPLQSGNDVLKLIIMMMELAITHTHTYDHCKTIWTLLLEKDPGNPQIDQLRTIHLYKADYNLLLKWFSSKGFILHSEKAQRINDNQGGGHAGRSAIDLAITKVLSYGVADTLWLQVTIIDNDATACFDCMIESQQPSMLATWSQPKVHTTSHPNTMRTLLPSETQIRNLTRIQPPSSHSALVWNGPRCRQRL